MSKGDIEHSNVEVKLRRIDRIYRPGDTVDGLVVITSRGGWSHQGINMRAVGQARMQLTSRSAGGPLEAFANMKPTKLLQKEFQALGPGKVQDGVTELPFSFKLPTSGLLETYHGVFIAVSYVIHCSCDRGVMKKALGHDMEFIVEVAEATRPEAGPDRFTLTPEALANVNSEAAASMPRFKISGRLFHRLCPINQPFTGEVTIEEAAAAVKFVELQLVRIETVKHPESDKEVREATEVQNIQIADGDVCRNLVIPMYMIFPRLYTCPTMTTKCYQVEFVVNLTVAFDDGYLVTEEFPIELYRGQ